MRVTIATLAGMLLLWGAGCGDEAADPGPTDEGPGAEVAADADGGGEGPDTADPGADTPEPDTAPDVQPDSAPDTEPDADVPDEDVPPEDSGPDVVEPLPEGPGLGIDYESTAPGLTPRYEPESDDWSAVGWPNDVFRDPETGSVDLSNFPNPGFDLITSFLEHGMATLDGWGNNGAVYFQFAGPIDMGSLPTPAEAMESGAVVQLVNVTEGSGRYGMRMPLEFRWYGEGSDPYYLPNTLALRQVFGFPLLGGETWCAVVTRGVKDAEGNYLSAAPAFTEAYPGEPALAPLVAYLGDSELAIADIAVASCFTAQRPTLELRKVYDFIDTLPPPEVEYVEQPNVFGEFHGVYVAPNFQSGVKPYETEGGLVFGEDGDPLVQLDEEIRFLMMIPTATPMPESGWPVVMYAHGTGGDYESCRNRSAELMAEGMALVCIDQPLHGSRGDDYSDDDLVYFSFNFLNPPAGRMAFRTAAIDTFNLSRLIASGGLDLEGAQTLSGQPVVLDPDKIYFFGHSHGGLSGSLALGVDARVKAGVLSGASGSLAQTILKRKDPFDIAAVVQGLLSLDPTAFDNFHPTMTLIQTLVEVTDPLNYAPFWLDPPPGGTAKHVFLSQGTEDHASPQTGNDALAAAGELPFLLPLAYSSPAHDLKGIANQAMPVSHNVDTPDGPRTAAAKAWQGGSHWVALWEPQARAMWRMFFRNLGLDEPPVLGEGDITVTKAAPVAAGDTCEGAGLIAADLLPATAFADTSLAADDYTTEGCGGDWGAGGRDLVFAFSPDADGIYRFTYDWPDHEDPKADPELGPNVAYVVTDCADIGATCLGRFPNTSIDLSLTAGETYYVVLDGAGLVDKGAVSLTVSNLCEVLECGDRECGAWGCGECGSCADGQVCSAEGLCETPATGDTCSDAWTIDAVPFLTNGATESYYNHYSYAKGDCPGFNAGYGAASSDVVYAFTAPSAQTYVFTLDASYDGNLYVVEDCADVPSTCLGAHRRGSGEERLVLPLEAAQSVFVIVDGAGNNGNSKGAYTLGVDVCVPECEGKACGGDGCGGECGACEEGTRCISEEICEPIPYICTGSATCEDIAEGDRCQEPFAIDALPFSVSASTKDLFDDHSYGSDQCAGVSGGWGGSTDDAVYMFTTAEEALYAFQMSSKSDASLSVSSACPDLGGTCLGAFTVKAKKGAKTLYETLPAGQTYYVLIEGGGSGYDLSIQTCVPSCEGKVCGSDGCGGSCGGCSASEKCQSGQCVDKDGYDCESTITVGKLPWQHKGNTGSGYAPNYENACGDTASGLLSNDVAYFFNPPADGLYHFTLNTDWAQLYVVTDCADVAGTCLGSSLDEGSSGELFLELTKGQVVRLVVDGNDVEGGEAVGGAYTLTVKAACFPACEGKNCGADGCGGSCGTCAAPADVCVEGVCTDPTAIEGNTCALPFEVGALPFTGEGDTSTAQGHYALGESHCPGWVGKSQFSHDQVWRLQASAAGEHVVRVAPGYDAAIYAVGDCADIPGTCHAASDTPDHAAEWLTLDLAAGETVYLIVDGSSNAVNDAGPYTLEVVGP